MTDCAACAPAWWPGRRSCATACAACTATYRRECEPLPRDAPDAAIAMENDEVLEAIESAASQRTGAHRSGARAHRPGCVRPVHEMRRRDRRGAAARRAVRDALPDLLDGGTRVEKLTSIFAAVEHPDSGAAVLDKAVALARHFDARVELLVMQPMNRTAFVPCSTALGYPQLTVRAVPRAGETRALAAAARSTRGRQPDLLIKAPAGAHPLRRWTLDTERLAAVAAVPGAADAGDRKALGETRSVRRLGRCIRYRQCRDCARRHAHGGLSRARLSRRPRRVVQRARTARRFRAHGARRPAGATGARISRGLRTTADVRGITRQTPAAAVRRAPVRSAGARLGFASARPGRVASLAHQPAGRSHHG